MLLLVIVALALATAQIVLAMKMKEGREWARFALTILVGSPWCWQSSAAGVADGRARRKTAGLHHQPGGDVLMWLPNAQAWFAANRGRTGLPPTGNLRIVAAPGHPRRHRSATKRLEKTSPE